MTDDRIAEILARHKSAELSDREQLWADIDFLLNEVGRLQRLYEASKAQVKAGAEEIERLRVEKAGTDAAYESAVEKAGHTVEQRDAAFALLKGIAKFERVRDQIVKKIENLVEGK